jgi:putative glycosyl hydrolase
MARQLTSTEDSPVRCRLSACLLSAVVLVGATLASSAPASAAASQDGWGFGISDPDPDPSRSLDNRFLLLRPKTFRFIVPWNAVDNAVIKAQARTQIELVRAAGVEEIAITFERPSTSVPPSLWLSKVTAFIDELTPHVQWWSPANEPNDSSDDLPRLPPTVLAQYSSALQSWLLQHHAEDQMISPDFADTGPIGSYIQEFRNAGGKFGSRIAWHPYSGVQAMSLDSTNELIAAVPPGVPIWITEIGVHVQDQYRLNQGEDDQNTRVQWLVNTLAAHPRVWRVNYWHMHDHNDYWDSALVRRDRTARPAWFTWCTATHGGDHQHYDCLDVAWGASLPPLPVELVRDPLPLPPAGGWGVGD